MTVGIEVDGLKEFSRNLKKLDRELPKALRQALNVSANLVADRAQPLVPTGPTGRARRSVKAASTQKTARVKGGGGRAPYYPWLDFGGRVGRSDSVVRPFRKDGRYLYPTLARHRDEIDEALQQALLEFALSVDIHIDTTGGGG